MVNEILIKGVDAEGKEIERYVNVREAVKPQKAYPLWGKQATQNTRLRHKMLWRLWLQDRIVEIPRELVEEAKDEFFQYAEQFAPSGNALVDYWISEVVGTFFDLTNERDCRRALGLYLEAYKELRKIAKHEDFPIDSMEDSFHYKMTNLPHSNCG